MITKTITHLLKKKLSLDIINVTGDINHIKILAVSDIFSNISELKKQQIIYKPLMTHIANKAIHAITINAYSIVEWNNKIQ